MQTTLPISLGWASDIGMRHPENEDSYVLFPARHGAILLVCDGMGGMGRGEEASQLAVRAAYQFLRECELEPGAALDEALRRADYSVRRALCVSEEERPGCTAAAAYVTPEGIQICWVGDSPIQWLSGTSLVRRTRDDKLIEDLIDQGTLTRAEAMNSPVASVLTKAIGGRPLSALPLSASIEPELWKLTAGDHLVICSDGLSDLVSSEEIAEVVASVAPQAASDALVALANARGGHDNITVVVARWGGSSTLDGPVSNTDVSARMEGMDDHSTDPHSLASARDTLPPDLFTPEPAPEVNRVVEAVRAPLDSSGRPEAHARGLSDGSAPPTTDGQIALVALTVALALLVLVVLVASS